MRQKHDENDEGKLDNGGRVVDEQTFLKVLDEGGIENQVEVGRLQADKGTQQVQGLYAMLPLQEEAIECKEKDLEESVKTMV